MFDFIENYLLLKDTSLFNFQCMLRYKSDLLTSLSTYFYSIPLIFGLFEQVRFDGNISSYHSETIRFITCCWKHCKLLTSLFKSTQRQSFSSANVTLSKPIQLYRYASIITKSYSQVPVFQCKQSCLEWSTCVIIGFGHAGLWHQTSSGFDKLKCGWNSLDICWWSDLFGSCVAHVQIVQWKRYQLRLFEQLSNAQQLQLQLQLQQVSK